MGLAARMTRVATSDEEVYHDRMSHDCDLERTAFY
jgi:hypothetical protein